MFPIAPRYLCHNILLPKTFSLVTYISNSKEEITLFQTKSYKHANVQPNIQTKQVKENKNFEQILDSNKSYK
jgi:hypothetical protein